MRRVAVALLALASATSAVAAETLPCSLRDLARPTELALPPTNPPDLDVPVRTARISAEVAGDGRLADATIDVSSGSHSFDRALQDYTKQIVVNGNCRLFGEGRLLLSYRPDHEGGPALAGASRAAHKGPDFQTDAGFLLTFAAGPGYTARPGEKIEDSGYACDVTLVSVRRKSMPADDGRLVADTIHELSDAGEILGTWRVPLEAEPLGVRGDTLVVDLRSASRPGVVAIGRDGSIVTADKPAPTAPDADMKCPESKLPESNKLPESKLPESGYRWCRRLEDGDSHAPRLVAYEGPCT